MITVPSVRLLYRNEDRLFNAINTLAIAFASIDAAISAHIGRPAIYRKYEVSRFECKVCEADIGFPLQGPLEFAIKNEDPKSISIGIWEKERPAAQINVWASGLRAKQPMGTYRFGKVHIHLVSAVFVEFYENYKEWIAKKFGHRDNWPAAWQFARVIRNSTAHNGKILIEAKNAMPVSWRSVTYSYANNGQQTVGGDLSIADVVVLMFEMNDELDSAGAPI